MTPTKPPKLNPRLPPQGLLLQLIYILLLPLTLLLVVITFGSISIHQKAMRTMVGERDERLVNSAARALSAQIDLRSKELTGVAVLLSSETFEPISSTISNTGYLRQDFDLGMAVYDAKGKLLATGGDSQLWNAESADLSSWQPIIDELKIHPSKIQVIISPVNHAYTGLISAQVNEYRMIVGAFSINTLVENTLTNTLPSESQLSVLLVDANQQLLYIAGDVKDYSINHPGITEALQGRTGTVYVKVTGDEHVTAYSPVETAGWALITEESWEAVATPTLRTTQVAPLVLVPALLIMLLGLWFGARQIVQPLRILESKAATLALGDFKSIQEPVGGIAEIQHLQKELVEMAHKVQDAQRSLHGYIGSITAAQEEERHRLARELHDDTLQALIALKQRVQLAQLELQSATSPSISETTESAELQEIASLTEQTIENLRRLTGALRPVYLEDLGLVPALEMLARETGQGMSITVKFQHQGVEKRLDPAIELALYRMAQEALSNITRHAQAKNATLDIAYTTKSVTMQIADDGVGFEMPKNPSEFSPSGHYGLLGLKERADLIGAFLEIHSSPGTGTKLIVTLPAQSNQTIQ
jgi:signal transduction histidine kinase